MSKPPSSIPSGAPALWQQLGATAQALQAAPATNLPALVALLLRTGALRAPEPC